MAEEKRKAATMFDFIDGVTHKKREWSKWSEMDQKAFSPFMMNRFLSMRMELTELVNEFQTYTIGLLRPQETYRLYFELLPNNKAFAKYIKGKSEDKYEKTLVDQIAEHYQVSRSEAADYLDLMDKTQCERILTMYGYSDGEKKKLLKGIK
jgi:hypothetical protein